MYRITLYHGKQQITSYSQYLPTPNQFECLFSTPSPSRDCLGEGFHQFDLCSVNVMWFPDGGPNERITQAANLARTKDTLCDKETSEFLAKIRVMPHNLDEHGTSIIVPFKNFRIGQDIYWFNAWNCSFYQSAR